MKIVLLEDVPNLGTAGQVKEVRPGYGRNYLLPKKLAALATPNELQRVQALVKIAERRRDLEAAELRELGAKIEGMSVTVVAKAGTGGRLYGSVTNADVAQALSNLLQREIDKRKIDLEEPLKELGTFPILVRLLPTVTPTIQVTVAAEQQETPQ